ncbi:MAG: hypothetical protein MUE54_15370 [Anaerolineae bacterium]|nr:hypothetical protein [Anaerolineae bacterium]
MGYYMRYFIPKSAQPLTLPQICDGIIAINTNYAIQIDSTDPNFGDIAYGERILGEIEINTIGDEIFEEETEDFLALLNHSQDEQKQVVIQTIQSAGQIVAISAIWRDGDADDADVVHNHLDPLWDWLDEHYNGMLHRDADGFYHGQTLILEMNVRI